MSPFSFCFDRMTDKESLSRPLKDLAKDLYRQAKLAAMFTACDDSATCCSHQLTLHRIINGTVAFVYKSRDFFPPKISGLEWDRTHTLTSSV